MKRLFVLLLLALLMPLQFSWAAVGAYCQHESGQKAGHFGHHSHDHKAADPAPDPSAPSGASLDQDCSACHQAALKLIFADSTRHPSPGACRGQRARVRAAAFLLPAGGRAGTPQLVGRRLIRRG